MFGRSGFLFHSLKYKIRTRERERLGDTQHKVVWTVLRRGHNGGPHHSRRLGNSNNIAAKDFTQQRFSLPLASGNKLNEGVERDESEIMFFLCRSMPPPTHFVFNRELISFLGNFYFFSTRIYRYFSRPLSFLFLPLFSTRKTK